MNLVLEYLEVREVAMFLFGLTADLKYEKAIQIAWEKEHLFTAPSVITKRNYF